MSPMMYRKNVISFNLLEVAARVIDFCALFIFLEVKAMKNWLEAKCVCIFPSQQILLCYASVNML